jgi:hypothetical protein
MKITKLETIWFDAVPGTVWSQQSPDSRQPLSNNLWVRVYSDDGLVALGDSYYLPRAAISVIDNFLGPLLIGRDVFDIENHLNNVFSLVKFCGFAGAEMRAVDVALWDLLDTGVGPFSRTTRPVRATSTKYALGLSIPNSRAPSIPRSRNRLLTQRTDQRTMNQFTSEQPVTGAG